MAKQLEGVYILTKSHVIWYKETVKIITKEQIKKG